jgi:hypothetical protein
MKVFHKMGLCRQALERSCLMVLMYNGRATKCNWVTLQCLQCNNVIYTYMMANTMVSNIIIVHKQVEIEMADGSNPPHKFTDLG